MLGAIIQQCMLPLAFYLRSFKREPFMWLSILTSVLPAVGTTILGNCFVLEVSPLLTRE